MGSIWWKIHWYGNFVKLRRNGMRWRKLYILLKEKNRTTLILAPIYLNKSPLFISSFQAWVYFKPTLYIVQFKEMQFLCFDMPYMSVMYCLCSTFHRKGLIWVLYKFMQYFKLLVAIYWLIEGSCWPIDILLSTGMSLR